jgi:hypothetical protein
VLLRNVAVLHVASIAKLYAQAALNFHGREKAASRAASHGDGGFNSACATRLSALADVDKRLEPMILARDPLHVAAVIGAAGAQGDDVIDVPPRAGTALAARGRAEIVSAEGAHLGSVARNGSRRRRAGKHENEGEER